MGGESGIYRITVVDPFDGDACEKCESFNLGFSEGFVDLDEAD